MPRAVKPALPGYVVITGENLVRLEVLNDRIYSIGDEELIASWTALPIVDAKNNRLISQSWEDYTGVVMSKAKDKNQQQLVKLVQEFEGHLRATDTNLDEALETARGLNRDMKSLEARLDKSLKHSVLAR